MRASRLLLLLVVACAGAYILKNYSGLFGPRPSEDASAPASPIEKARAVRDANDRKNAAREGATREADSAPAAAGVTENMTPDQVRALLGPPDETSTGTADNGKKLETWTYRSAGKTVVFEDGVAVSVR